MILKILAGLALFAIEAVLFVGVMTIFFAGSKLEPRTFQLAQGGFYIAIMIALAVFYVAWLFRR